MALVIMVLVFGQSFSKLGSLYFNAGVFKLGLLFSGLGYCMLILRGGLWIIVLKKMPLSIAYPIMSIAYVIIPILSYFVFGERLSPLKIFACLVILIGVIITAQK